MLAAAGLSPAQTATIPEAKLHDQIRGGLLGHILGDLNGLQHEFKYIDEPGDVRSYTPALPEGASTDDDTDIEWIYLVEMQRSRTLLIPYPRISELWKRHINRRIWCSHLYLRQLIDIGIDPPLTGSVHLNPWADFNLSAQFACESWGLIAPGMPQTAARIGTHYTHVSIDGEALQSTQLFTSMIATAFLTGDIAKIVQAGLAAVDPASLMHHVVTDVVQWHHTYPAEWQTTRRLLRDKYTLHGGRDMRDRNGVILNGGSAVAALLYGKGNFVETARQGFQFGWDADNNSATAGTIAGIIEGYERLSSHGWNIKDVFRNTSRDNMPEDETITRFGDRLIDMAGQVIAENGGEKTAAGYRIQTQAPGLLEKLPDRATELAAMRSRLRPEIEQDRSARAAYLAICLDLPARNVRALEQYPKLLQVMFYQSAIPAGDRIREKALAAGIRKPEKVALSD
jgi:hypothetical protein